MHDMNPHKISLGEWAEILKTPAVREAWGLDENVTPDEFRSLVYGVKFDFMSGSPGYVGDVYILQGDHLTERPPMLLRRLKDGSLTES